MADILARAGLHLSASTVKRMIDEPPMEPANAIAPTSPPISPTVQAWYPDHVWSVDLTVVPSTDGFWVPWSPNALTQVYPYSWYVMVVIDHYSRRVMDFDVFEQQPTALEVNSAMQRIYNENNAKPKYLISDQGVQFVANEFRNGCLANGIKQKIRSHWQTWKHSRNRAGDPDL
jgi:transposase InsO family protein